MHRRDALRLGSQALLMATVAPQSLCGRLQSPPRRSSTEAYLFFAPEDVPRIRTNARTPLLQPVFERWRAEPPETVYAAVDHAVATGNLLADLRDAVGALTQAGVVHLVEPTAARRDALRYGIERLITLPKWDYFLDGGTDVIGIMRASLVTARLLFVREVLRGERDPALDDALLEAIAEKGCLPCYRTIYGMDHPDEVRGWSFDDAHQSVYEIDMQRWPEILGANNLRAIPTMGLGLGALALQGHDDRADRWLDTATRSAQRFLGYFSPDGSYFEGISYVDYALRTLLAFLDAHQRLEDTVDWTTAFNARGVIDFILTMQAGYHDDGTPDVVNFSDSRKTVFPCVPAWIARQTGSGVAQFAAEHVSEPGYYLDFLWYDPDRATAPPPDRLKNNRLDLDWIVCRTGWEAGDAVLAFRSGEPANHEHADRNSFLFKIHGERLLTDPVGAAYDWRQPGWLLRLTEAHNAVLIDGEGHQYHHGEEGTNASQAEARIVRFEDADDRVWWTSDATQAYRLVNPDVARVVRTVLFAKPNVVVLLDQVTKDASPSDVALRFFPDNRDGAAQVEETDDAFVLWRPGARLHGSVFAVVRPAVGVYRLDLPKDLGVYPFVEVTSLFSIHHEILTVLVALPVGAGHPPTVEVQEEMSAWRFAVGDVRGRIDTSEEVPEVRWG